MKANRNKTNTTGPSTGAFSTIGLSKPAQRALAGKSINTLKQLSKYSEKEILGLHGIGRTAIPVLKQAMKSAGLFFKKKDVSPVFKKKPVSVNEYLASLPPDAGSTLRKVRKAIISAAPDAEEKMNYGVPFYRQNGHLTAFLCAKNNCSLVTMSYDVLKKFKKELEPYKISGTTIHFPFNSPLPSGLVKKIIKARLAENDTKRKLKNKNK